MLIISQRPTASRVASFHTWREFGRFVKKGAKGIAILVPIFRKKASEENSDEEDSNRLVGFRPVYVFDLTDTDKDPLPALNQTRAILPGIPSA